MLIEPAKTRCLHSQVCLELKQHIGGSKAIPRPWIWAMRMDLKKAAVAKRDRPGYDERVLTGHSMSMTRSTTNI